jgi:hypothetical protein
MHNNGLYLHERPSLDQLFPGVDASYVHLIDTPHSSKGTRLVVMKSYAEARKNGSKKNLPLIIKNDDESQFSFVDVIEYCTKMIPPPCGVFVDNSIEWYAKGGTRMLNTAREIALRHNIRFIVHNYGIPTQYKAEWREGFGLASLLNNKDSNLLFHNPGGSGGGGAIF